MESTLDTEAVLSNLKELAGERQQKIPQILEDYLLQVARTGNVVFENEWSDVKRLLKLKLDCNIEYFQTFCGDLPTDKDFSLHNARAFLNDRFEFFTRPPFTIQRLVEVLTTSRRQYRRIDKYLRAVEKNLMVVSTIGQEVEFHCEAKYVPHISFSSPTVSKVGQADLIPLQNAAMGFDVRSNRVAMRIFNPALNLMNGDESDDEDEDEDMDDDPDVPFSHPALDGSEPMDGAAESNGNDSPGRKGLLRKRKLRPSPPTEQISITTITATSSAVAASTLTPVTSQAEPVAMETTAAQEDTVNGSEAKETEPPTAILGETTTPKVEPTQVPVESVEVKVEEKEKEKEKEEEKMETVTEPVEEPKEMVVEKIEEVVKLEVKPELKSEEEVKDLDQSSDLEKPMEKEEAEPKLESDEKKTPSSAAAAEEISEKPSADKTESAETEQAADSEIPSS